MVDIIKDPITAPPKVNKTEGKPDVVILLDESGSMAGHRDEVVSTFNEYVQSIKKTAHSVSLYTFDSEGWSGNINIRLKEKLFKVNPSRVPKLTNADYEPTGATPLFDSMGAIMQKFDNSGRNVQFVTHTDGQENASKEWNFESLENYIAKLTKKGWLFVYLGEGVQGKETMSSFQGLKMDYSSHNRVRVMKGLAQTTALYASGVGNSMSEYAVDGSDTLNMDDETVEVKSSQHTVNAGR
jgi:uncharacterized protein with von Willebrand factor type A (vWA) domain